MKKKPRRGDEERKQKDKKEGSTKDKKQSSIVIIGSHPQKRGKNWKENVKSVKGAREWVRQRRGKEMREREREWVGKAYRCHGNWELSADSMFSTHSPPTTNSFPFPSQSVHLSITSPPAPPAFFSFSHSAYRDHTLFTFLSHTPATSLRHLSLSTSTTPLFLPTSPSHPFFGFVSTHSLSYFLCSSLFFLPSPPLSSHFHRLNPQPFAKSSKEETETSSRKKKLTGLLQALWSERRSEEEKLRRRKQTDGNFLV